MESRSAGNGLARVQASLGQVWEILVRTGLCSTQRVVSDTYSWLAGPFPVHTANSHCTGCAAPCDQLRQAGCLHRAVKTQCCEHWAAAAPRTPARNCSFASSAPAEIFHGRRGLFSAHGMVSFALQIVSAFPMAAAQQWGSVFLWEGNKLLHHCDLCVVSC